MASAESDLERCTTQSSSSTPASTDSTEPSSQTSVSAKQALRRRIFQRQREQGQKEKVETERQVEESRVLENLRRIQEGFSAAGYRSEVLAVGVYKSGKVKIIYSFIAEIMRRSGWSVYKSIVCQAGKAF